MKLLATLLAVFLVGCAGSRAPYQSQQAWSYQELSTFKVNNSMCPKIDYYVNLMETQLRLKGLYNATPEDLNDADRQYNAEARIIIWSLRIGCNNPNRYKS
jgi:hypothetical protein